MVISQNDVALLNLSLAADHDRYGYAKFGRRCCETELLETGHLHRYLTTALEIVAVLANFLLLYLIMFHSTFSIRQFKGVFLLTCIGDMVLCTVTLIGQPVGLLLTVLKLVVGSLVRVLRRKPAGQKRIHVPRSERLVQRPLAVDGSHGDDSLLHNGSYERRPDRVSIRMAE